MHTLTDHMQQRGDVVWLTEEMAPIGLMYFLLRPEPLPVIEA